MRRVQKLAFDVDGVLANFLLQYESYYNRIHPAEHREFCGITDYNIPGQCGELWRLSGYYDDIPVMEGAVETVKALAGEYELHCITATPYYAVDDRKRWLMCPFPEFPKDNIHFVEASDKKAFCGKLGIDLLVEDCPKTCASFATDQVFVFQWEYNKHLNGQGYHVGRFAELREYLKIM